MGATDCLGLGDHTAGSNRDAEATFFYCPREKSSSGIALMTKTLLPPSRKNLDLTHRGIPKIQDIPDIRQKHGTALQTITQPLLLLAAGLRIRALQSVHFQGISAASQGNKVFLYRLLRVREMRLF